MLVAGLDRPDWDQSKIYIENEHLLYESIFKVMSGNPVLEKIVLPLTDSAENAKDVICLVTFAMKINDMDLEKIWDNPEWTFSNLNESYLGIDDLFDGDHIQLAISDLEEKIIPFLEKIKTPDSFLLAAILLEKDRWVDQLILSIHNRHACPQDIFSIAVACGMFRDFMFDDLLKWFNLESEKDVIVGYYKNLIFYAMKVQSVYFFDQIVRGYNLTNHSESFFEDALFYLLRYEYLEEYSCFLSSILLKMDDQQIERFRESYKIRADGYALHNIRLLSNAIVTREYLEHLIKWAEKNEHSTAPFEQEMARRYPSRCCTIS